MARGDTLQTNFSGGELSPRLYGRVDLAKYNDSVKEARDVVILQHGGAIGRPGTDFLGEVADSADITRLIPFVYSQTDAYVLEHGDASVRVWKSGALVAGPVTFASAYSSAQVFDVDYIQGADTMFTFHPSVAIQRLQRFSDTVWRFQTAPLDPAPFDEVGSRYGGATATLSAATVGAGRTITSSYAGFRRGDIGRKLISGAGIATVTGYTSQTVLVVEITTAFSGTALSAGAWYLDSSPQCLLKPYDDGPVGAVIYLTAALTRAADITLSAKTGAGVTITASAAVFVAGDVGKLLYAGSGTITITGYTDTTHITGNVVDEEFNALSYSTGAWGIEGDAFTAEDVGKYVRINGGLCEIVTSVSVNAMQAKIITELTSNIVAPAGAWTLEATVWSTEEGYPKTGSLHEQRLIAASTARFPQTVWGSRSGAYLDFTPGVDDDHSYSFTMASDEINPIQFMAAGNELVGLTYGGGWVLSGGIEKPITPTNIRAKQYARAGSATVRPEQIDEDLYYVQRGVSQVRTFGYDMTVGGYQSSEASTLSEHLVRDGIEEISFQQSPERVAWLRREDGKYVAMTVSKEQNIRAYTLCELVGGVVESMATIPEDGEDHTYLLVRRTINGATKRYVERMNWAAYQDCRKVVTLSPASATVTGLSHLEGKTVCAVADGVDLGDFTVSSGSITLPRTASSVSVGIRYTPTIKMLPPETGTGMGASTGRRVHNGKTLVLFKDTVGCNVNGQPLAFRQFGESVLDSPVDPFSGWKDVSDVGWDRDAAEIELTQPQAYPWCILSVVRRITANPG